MEVGSLICPINKCWKIDLVKQHFLPFEVERILNIPISSRLPEDIMFWELEANGCYSVKSAYRALLGDSKVFHEASSSSVSDLWQTIWRAKVLPRVKLFAWRACNEALPTRLGLSHRISSMDVVCSQCGGVNEFGFHAIHMCPRAKEVWDLSSFQLHQPLEGTRLADLWYYSLKEMNEEEIALFLTLGWAIWNARCKSMIEQEVVLPSETYSFAIRTCEDMRRAADERPKEQRDGSGVQHAVRWSPPATSWWKVNMDAGCGGVLGVGLGCVCRDNLGSVVGCVVAQYNVEWEVCVAEAKAMLTGVQLAVELGCSKVIFESDSLLVINALKGKSKGSSLFHLIIEDILVLCSKLTSFVWSFVKRSGNSVAHALAHFQPVEVGKRVWVDDVPDLVVSLASANLI